MIRCRKCGATFDDGPHAGSLPVFRELAQRKLRMAKTLKLHASPDHLHNLADYLDPSLEFNSVDLYAIETGHVESTIFELRRLLPVTSTLKELSIAFSEGPDPSFDTSALFLSPSLRSIGILGGAFNSAPPNHVVRKLSLSELSLGPSAIRSLSTLTALKSLRISSASMSVVEVVNDTNASSKLRNLDLSSVVIGANQWLASLMPSLRNLTMAGCTTLPNQPFHMGLVLRANVSSLQSLELSHSNFGPEGTDWLRGVFPFLYGSDRFRKLRIEGMPMLICVPIWQAMRVRLLAYICLCVWQPLMIVMPAWILSYTQKSVEHFYIGQLGTEDRLAWFVATLQEQGNVKGLPTLVWGPVMPRMGATNEAECYYGLVRTLEQLNQQNWTVRSLRRSRTLPCGLWATFNLRYRRNRCSCCGNYFYRDVSAASVVYGCLRNA